MKHFLTFVVMMSLTFTAVHPASIEHLWGHWSSEDGARVTPADLCDFTTPYEGPTGLDPESGEPRLDFRNTRPALRLLLARKPGRPTALHMGGFWMKD
jgi:hypothetical protein